ncbi:MAG: glycosyltransferase family 2 protein [Anaplasmataceae bacterium]|nr:glycosyltransferase family 2 protein [Anaplasmataceae bacterium]
MNNISIVLSVVIVCTNEKKFLDSCLISVINSIKNTSYEIIVVDNASTDGSRELIQEYYSSVKLIKNPINKGAAFARNFGAKQALGEFIAFLDCDTQIQGTALEDLVYFLKINKDAGIVSPQLVYPDGSLQYSCRPFPNLFIFFLRLVWDGDMDFLKRTKRLKRLRNYFMVDWDHDSMREVDWTMSACWVLRREIFEEIGMFDSGYFYNYEDVDFSWRVKKAGRKIIYYPEAKVIHHYQRLSAKGGIMNPLKWHHLKSAIRFFIKKHF